MGLKLRVNLYYQQDHKQVYEALFDFYQSIGKSFQFSGNQFHRLDLFQSDGQWVLLTLDGGWNHWQTRQKACKQVSAVLQCTGFSLFVYDGDFWGYTMLHSGEEVDHFIQVPEKAGEWFPGASGSGNAQVVSTYLPHLNVNDISPYLIQHPVHLDDDASDDELLPWWNEYEKLDVLPRQGDEFSRWHECAILDFQRLLGIRVELRDHYVRYHVPLWRSFWIQ